LFVIFPNWLILPPHKTILMQQTNNMKANLKLLAAAFVLCFTVAACGSGESETAAEPAVDSTATVAPVDTSAAPVVDTMKMDTADTRGVNKPGTAPAQQ
jgi:hypothetical protein